MPDQGFTAACPSHMASQIARGAKKGEKVTTSTYNTMPQFLFFPCTNNDVLWHPLNGQHHEQREERGGGENAPFLAGNQGECSSKIGKGGEGKEGVGKEGP